ncbi:MAG TPA: FMN-binding protein [Rectinemataceae bacterium]|nr:FMN-binding protein [Rectinemataceae bacterium]
MKPKANLYLVAIALVSLGSVFSCAMDPVPVAVMPDISAKANGVYTGGYDGGLVKATVAVTLSAGRIDAIKILSHDCGPVGKKGEAVVDRVVEKQTLAVDVVSGATGSSMVLLKAIEIAISGESDT